MTTSPPAARRHATLRLLGLAVVFGLVVGAVMGLIGAMLDLPSSVTGAITGGTVVVLLGIVRRRDSR